MIKRYLYIVAGVLFLAMAIVGVFVPLLPSTPFGLLAIFFFSRSSLYLYNLCLSFPVIGKALKDWQKNKSISPFSKILAVSFLSISIGHVLRRPNIPVVIKVVAGLFMLGLMIFILSRNSKPPPQYS